MGSIQRGVRFAAFAGGALLVGLSVVAFDNPLPQPTISPVLPLPSPSVPVSLPNLLNTSPGGSPAGGDSPSTHQTAAGVGSTPPASASGGTGSIATAPGLAFGGQDSVAPPAQAPPAATLAAAEQSRAAATLPRTGRDPGGPNSPLPLAPGAMVGALLALLFAGLRMSGRPPNARRYRIRIEFAAPGAPAGAAASAVRCLLESELPADARLRAAGDGAFLLEAPMLQRAVLGTRLAEVAGRARRVGLRIDWSLDTATTEPRSATQPRLALG